jgi:hypothetical protein
VGEGKYMLKDRKEQEIHIERQKRSEIKRKHADRQRGARDTCRETEMVRRYLLRQKGTGGKCRDR